MTNKSSHKSLLKIGISGTIVTAFCCFTPVLAVSLGATGLGVLTGYLDYVLLPALCIFVIIMIYALVKR